MTATLRIVFGSSMRCSPRIQPLTPETSPTRCACRGGGMRRFVVCSIAGALTASAALGQSLTGPVTQGAVPPGQSFSLQDDGSSLAGNPAGLGFVRGFEADFLHNGYYGSRNGDANALDLAFGAGPLALALGFDWLNQSDASGSRSSYRRTSIGGALRLGELSLGAVHRGFSGVDLSQAWDFGALARPFRWLSLGAAALDANRPALLPRQWVMSAALRPWRERLDLAADLRWTECTNAPAGSACGIDHRNWIFTAQARVRQGVTLIGQLAVLDGSQTTGLVGLQLDLGHLGVTYGTGMGGLPAWDTWRLRASTERWPALRVLERAVEIDLRKALSPPRPGPLALVFGATSRDPLAETILTLRRLSRDPATRLVVLRSGGLPLGLGRAEELRAAIENLKGSGKKVLFYLESGGDLEYSVALAADRIYTAPEAVLLVNGFAATALFAAAGLDKLGVKAEFFRVGAYKNAPDLFTRSGMSREQREVESSLLDDLFGRYLKRISDARHLDESRVKSLLDEGILKPGEAVQAGLIDGLVYPDQLQEEAGKLLGRKVSLRKVGTDEPALRDVRWGGRPEIASMGDVAASGGYYVAAGADAIFAEPGTVTGSIGVFVGHFDASELLGKLGLNLETVKRGASADLFSPNRSLTERERKTLQSWVDNFYDGFVSRVAEARGLSKADVDRVGQGRVWTGAQALDRGLIDRIGGLEDALAEAKRRAGLGPDSEIEVQDEESLSVDLTDFAGASALDVVPMGMGPRAVRALQLLGEPGTLRAVLPYDLEVQ